VNWEGNRTTHGMLVSSAVNHESPPADRKPPDAAAALLAMWSTTASQNISAGAASASARVSHGIRDESLARHATMASPTATVTKAVRTWWPA